MPKASLPKAVSFPLNSICCAIFTNFQQLTVNAKFNILVKSMTENYVTEYKYVLWTFVKLYSYMKNSWEIWNHLFILVHKVYNKINLVFYYSNIVVNI